MHFDNGNLIAEIGPLGRSTQYAFDAQNHLALVTAPATTDHATGKTHYAYDLRGDLVSVTDPWGRETNYEYDARRRLTREISPASAAGEARPQYAYE